MAHAPGAMPSLADTFGAAYVGSSINLMLYGITTVQTWFYFVSYPKDSAWLKITVLVLWLMDTGHTALVAQVIYHYLIANFGKTAALLVGTTPLYTSIALNVSIAFLCQSFFVGRIYRLCGPRTKMWLPAVCGVFTVLHFGFGIATVIAWAIRGKYSRLTEIIDMPITPFAVSAVASDIAIAAALCSLLWHTRAATSFADTSSVIASLMLWAINRCILTSAVALAETAVFVARPHDFWFLGTDFVIGKLYANSLLATLNARRALKGRGTNSDYSSGASTSLQMATAISGDMMFARPSARHTVTGGSTFDSAMRHPRGGLTVDIELQDSSVSRGSHADLDEDREK